MQYEIQKEDGYTLLRLTGEVDLHESPRARKQILDGLQEGRHLLVDLSAVSYIDSSGIASLVEGLQLAKRNQLDFGLVGISEAVRRVLQLARLDQVFPIYDSVTTYTTSP